LISETWITKADGTDSIHKTSSPTKMLSKNVGKLLTVKYQELTDDSISRFPVGISIRDDIQG
jgi:hypothetical protein